MSSKQAPRAGAPQEEARQRAAYGRRIEERAKAWRILRDANQAAAWEWAGKDTWLGWPAAVLPVILAGGASLTALFALPGIPTEVRQVLTAGLAAASAALTATTRFFKPAEKRDGHSRKHADYDWLAQSAKSLVDLGVSSSILPLAEIKKQFEDLEKRAGSLAQQQPLITRKHQEYGEAQEAMRQDELFVAEPYPKEVTDALELELTKGRFYKTKQVYNVEAISLTHQKLILRIDITYTLVNRTEFSELYEIGITASGPRNRYLIATINGKPIDLNRPDFRAGPYLLIPRWFDPHSSADVRLVAECEYRSTDTEYFTTFIPAAEFELRITNRIRALTIVCEPVMRSDVEPTINDSSTKCYAVSGVLPYQGFRLSWHRGEDADSGDKAPAAEDVSELVAAITSSPDAPLAPGASPTDDKEDRLRAWRQRHRPAGKLSGPAAKLCPPGG